MRVTSLDPDPFHGMAYTVGSAISATLPFLRGAVDALPDGFEAIVAMGDLQGVVPGGAGSASETLLGEAVAAEMVRLRGRGELPPREMTAVLLTGDLQPSAGVDDVRRVWFAMGEVSRWVAGVAGNHDVFGSDPRDTDAAANFSGMNLHFFDDRIEQIGEVLIGGLSGIVGIPGEPWVRTESEFAAAMARLADRRPDLLVSHDGPNAGTALAGWPSVRRVLESAPPTLLFRGHDPWSTPLATLANGTQVVNAEGRVVVLTGGAST
jgi:3',5'-cyclic-AMP phosphodiesterase